jgi:hypothetical protein
MFKKLMKIAIVLAIICIAGELVAPYVDARSQKMTGDDVTGDGFRDNVMIDIDRYYPLTGIITANSDTIVFIDSVGNEWHTSIDAEDYFIGDTISVIVDNMGTETIYDDEIVDGSDRYCNFALVIPDRT